MLIDVACFFSMGHSWSSRNSQTFSVFSVEHRMQFQSRSWSLLQQLKWLCPDLDPMVIPICRHPSPAPSASWLKLNHKDESCDLGYLMVRELATTLWDLKMIVTSASVTSPQLTWSNQDPVLTSLRDVRHKKVRFTISLL
jgi:hypothetical protein